MKQYLLSIYQPDGDPPPSEVAIRTDLLRRLDRNTEAVLAYQAAITRTDNATERNLLERSHQALTRA